MQYGRKTAKWYYGGDATGRKRTAGRSERGHEQCTAGVERVSKYRLEKNRSDIPYELRQRSYTGISGGCLEADTAGETAAGHLCTESARKITGTILAITGYSLTGVFALSTIVTGIVTAIYPGAPAIIATAIVGGITAASLGMGITGTVIRGRVKRFRQYVQQIGDRAYCNIKELADKTGKTEIKVRKDLKLMIEKRMFLQGHLDQKETCLIVTDAMYQQYLETEKQAKTVQLQQQQQKEQRSRMPEECRKILEEGQEYITYIHKCNDDLPGEEITRKLSRLEAIITRIFQEVEKQPELASDLRRFMNYYLPTTRKLVDAYREIELDSFRTEQNEKTKKEIEDTLDTINQAFEKLLNSFFEERAMDISSDISVLHSMLAQEGLTQGAFEQKTGYKDQI
ncbi:hypothetical protein DW961_09565 [Blautia sp. AM46-3MH]|nr:hypothetical protein DW961_09565 [Blautia sp. AM46-3MH]